MSLANLLHASASAYPDRPALSVGTQVHASYGQLRERVVRLAAGICGIIGNQPDERVAIVARNSPAYVELMWAAWHAGYCIVPVNAKLHPREVAYILDHSGASLCFVDESLVESMASAVRELDGLKRVVPIGSAEHLQMLSAEPKPLSDVTWAAPAWFFYTSGTTGKPKGAILSHHNLLAMSLRNFADIDALSSLDCIIHVAPFSHATGLFSLAHIAKASNHVFPVSQGFEETEIAELINAYDKATIFMAPTMLNRFTNHSACDKLNVDHLKTVIYGGAPMYLEDLKRALRRLGPCLMQAYGQGETPNTITFLAKAWHADTSHPRYDQILTTVGIPRTGVEVRAVDYDDRDVPAGEIGEIIVRSEVTMSGYWQNPDATATALRGGWLHTGDLGCFDAHGFLTLKDRSKDVIISGGTNIYPREVEEVILMHEGVLEAAVVGRKSAQWGEEVLAFVVRRPGSTLTAADLDKLCLDNIARFKRPKSYEFVENLPKNNYGKILKTELRLLAEQSNER